MINWTKTSVRQEFFFPYEMFSTLNFFFRYFLKIFQILVFFYTRIRNVFFVPCIEYHNPYRIYVEYLPSSLEYLVSSNDSMRYQMTSHMQLHVYVWHVTTLFANPQINQFSSLYIRFLSTYSKKKIINRKNLKISLLHCFVKFLLFSNLFPTQT